MVRNERTGNEEERKVWKNENPRYYVERTLVKKEELRNEEDKNGMREPGMSKKGRQKEGRDSRMSMKGRYRGMREPRIMGETWQTLESI